jgi:hypothetical protein
MKRILLGSILGLGLSLFFLWMAPRMVVIAEGDSQIPTGSIATVTGTQVGALATVLQNEQGFANLRAGPNTLGYDVVGVLLVGQQVPALGRSPGGNWIMVAYPGAPGGTAWVFSDLVEIKGSLPIVEPPATVTPQTTPTLDPTLVAQFELDMQPTRLPTYTAPPPLVLPTVGSDIPQTISGRIPVALLIIGLGVLGLFGLLISLLRSQ